MKKIISLLAGLSLSLSAMSATSLSIIKEVPTKDSPQIKDDSKVTPMFQTLLSLNDPEYYLSNLANIRQRLALDEQVATRVNVFNTQGDRIIKLQNHSEGIFLVDISHKNVYDHFLKAVLSVHDLSLLGIIVGTLYYHFEEIHPRYKQIENYDTAGVLGSSSNYMYLLRDPHIDPLFDGNTIGDMVNALRYFNANLEGEYNRWLVMFICLTTEALRFTRISNFMASTLILQPNSEIQFKAQIYDVVMDWKRLSEIFVLQGATDQMLRLFFIVASLI